MKREGGRAGILDLSCMLLIMSEGWGGNDWTIEGREERTVLDLRIGQILDNGKLRLYLCYQELHTLYVWIILRGNRTSREYRTASTSF